VLPASDLDEIRAGLRATWRARGEEADHRAAVPPRRARAAWTAALAATLAAAIGLVWWWGTRPLSTSVSLAQVEAVAGRAELVAPGAPRPLVVGARLRRGASLRTAADPAGAAGRVALRLAGGASLRVDAGSRVRLSGPSTVSLEEGALYVDSGGGRGAPIEVVTPLGSVRELGTRFAVRLAGAGPALVVRVREGAVAAATGGRRLVARRGEELVVRADGTAATRPAAAWGPDWAWVMAAGPRFASDGRTVGELLDWVAAETGWRVELDEGARARRRVVLHGDIGALPADRAAFVLLPGAALTAELRDDGTLVVSAATPRTAR
jgi:ferric-dicitrate binding protein FerR (iron transport regulator)